MAAPQVNTFYVEGLDRLLKTIEKLQDEAGAEFAAAAQEAGEIIRQQAQIEAPHLTGRLENSIQVPKTRRGVKVRIPKRVPYAKAIHFGWPRHNIVPNRFLFRAVDAKVEEASEVYLRRVIKVWEDHIG